MAHFAEVKDGKVTRVLVANKSFIDRKPGLWVQTSYNVRGGVYYDPATNRPAEDQSVIDGDEARMRKNYAGIGYTYDSERDAFIPPKPFNSWVLNEDSCLWEPPVAYPDDGEMYSWDEDTTSWQLVENGA